MLSSTMTEMIWKLCIIFEFELSIPKNASCPLKKKERIELGSLFANKLYRSIPLIVMHEHELSYKRAFDSKLAYTKIKAQLADWLNETYVFRRSGKIIIIPHPHSKKTKKNTIDPAGFIPFGLLRLWHFGINLIKKNIFTLKLTQRESDIPNRWILALHYITVKCHSNPSLFSSRARKPLRTRNIYDILYYTIHYITTMQIDVL